jgi:tRNA dimethylallyltransferase
VSVDETDDDEPALAPEAGADLPPLSGRAWFLTGATASGKSALGLLLAERLGAEIVSLDSMALYRGLDIGTAKPSRADQTAVPHHLIDVLEPDQDYSLADYVTAAHRVVDEIRSRGREPLFVGGTPLYLKALLRGIFTGPAADWELRHRLAEAPPGELHARLAGIDPPTAARLHPNDTRRLIRAIEVHEKTGRPMSAWQQQFDRARPAAECRVFVLDWRPDELRPRIDRRVDAMFAEGLVDEVRGILARGVSLGRTAGQAVGYREVLEHLEGQADLAATIERVKFATHRFARRQRTWFRSLSECRTIEMSPGVGPGDALPRILQADDPL